MGVTSSSFLVSVSPGDPTRQNSTVSTRGQNVFVIIEKIQRRHASRRVRVPLRPRLRRLYRLVTLFLGSDVPNKSSNLKRAAMGIL